MTGTYKKYNQQLSDVHDTNSRIIVKNWFKKIKNIDLSDGKLYGVDLISDAGFVVELEHRPPWTTKHFPFDTISILERKKKWFDLNGFYCIISNDFTRLGFCQLKTFNNYELTPRNNRFQEGEYGILVPIEKWIFFDA